MRTEAELKQIAIDLFDGKIFCDQHIPPDSSLHTMPMVFMPIILGALDQYTGDRKEIGMIFEYLDKAGPRSINGYPNFFSMQILTQAEWEIAHKYYEEYKEMKEKFQSK